MDSNPHTQAQPGDPAPHPAPCGHLVQFYADHNRLLDTLEGFISAGLCSGEGVVVIATRRTCTRSRRGCRAAASTW
jgi:hypothetical protein